VVEGAGPGGNLLSPKVRKLTESTVTKGVPTLAMAKFEHVKYSRKKL